MKNVFNSEILNSFSGIYKLQRKILQKDAEKMGLTIVQLKALYKISNHPEIRLTDLADLMQLTNSTVSNLIDRLVEHGYVKRHIPKSNRRVITIRLSEKGENKIKEAIESESELVKKLDKIKQLPDEDIQYLLRIHKQIMNILSE
ncbi:MarR family winged helix-turn-helix transcriptional regulator [Bacillus andreraoultii]|uniref:MarR family winged helix-turn-helix transcriptional regulator n=1 Tax=Bacillus andreraoultii TaxID=1499685 RepID=UPI00053B8FDC|nr:MarR family transcriptional regulator [Bacillus andreraoultii]